MKPSQKSNRFGSFFILIFVLICAIQDVYLGDFFQKENPLIVIVFTFTPAMILFLLTQKASFSEFRKQVKTNAKTIFFLNVTTLASLGGLYLALVYIEPAIVNMISFTLGPIIIAFFWRFLRPQKPIFFQEQIASLGIFLGLLILMIATLQGNSAIKNLSVKTALLGFGFSFLSAGGGIANTLLSKKLSEHHFSPSAIMAVRFQLLVFVGFLCLLSNHKIQTPIVTFLGMMALLSLMTVIIPLFLFQKGLETSEPITVSLLLASTPVFTYIFQLFDPRLHFSFFTTAGILLAFFSSMIGVIIRYQKEHA